MTASPKRLLNAALAGVLALSVAAPAMAEDHHGGDRHFDSRYYDRNSSRHYDRDDHRGWDRGRRDWDGDHDGWRHEAYERERWDRRWEHEDWRRHRFCAGEYLPRTGYVVVNDYYRYRLPPPRRGHYYARVNDDVLLVAAATGLVVWALSGSN